MKISTLLKERETTISFEIFPPKQWDKIDNTKKIVGEMAKSKPDFMSVTYGASGNEAGFTTEIAKEVKDSGIAPLSHLTCLTSTKDKVDSVLHELKKMVLKICLPYVETFHLDLSFLIVFISDMHHS